MSGQRSGCFAGHAKTKWAIDDNDAGIVPVRARSHCPAPAKRVGAGVAGRRGARRIAVPEPRIRPGCPHGAAIAFRSPEGEIAPRKRIRGAPQIVSAFPPIRWRYVVRDLNFPPQSEPLCRSTFLPDSAPLRGAYCPQRACPRNPLNWRCWQNSAPTRLNFSVNRIANGNGRLGRPKPTTGSFLRVRANKFGNSPYIPTLYSEGTQFQPLQGALE